MSESFIQTNAAGNATGFVGPDAIELFRAVTLKGAIQLYAQCRIIPTRGMTISKMLKLASRFSGKSYGRGQYDAAVADLDVWIATMKAALPVVPGKA